MLLRHPPRRWLSASVASALVAAACGGIADTPVTPVPAARPQPDVGAAAPPPVRISEIHYDNVGTDAGEAVEVSFPTGTDLTNWKIVRYNGSNSAAAVVYTTPGVASGSSET